MIQNKEFEVIISTCGKFSDLWDAHVLLLNKNWKERGRTWLVTDDPTDRCFEGVELLSVGAGTEITQRLEKVLEQVESEYLLFTLDDYFLTETIDNSQLSRALAVMKKEKLDYLLLHSRDNWFAPKKFELRREGAMELPGHPGFWLRDVSRGNYKVSLYPGLWRTDFMRKTLNQVRNAWQYEVALTALADELNARCAVSLCSEFPFLDVIRKGKVLRKAQCYFEKNPIYSGNRQTMPFWQEWRLNFRAFLGKILPSPLFRALKKLMIRCGMKFYSPVK